MRSNNKMEKMQDNRNEFIIEVRDVHKEFGKGKDAITKVLDGASMNVRKGEFVSLMGPSGTGKSTLLYLIGGLDREYKGDIVVCGKNIGKIKEKELSKSMLEVAAIIAYKQPVTRIDLEEIRGNSEYAVQKLLELGVIEPVGRKDAVGRPVMFGTTDKFLKRFQISSLDELPDYEELINRIQLIHGQSDNESYLYKKDEYSEEPIKEAAATAEETQIAEKTEDFDLPDMSEEEIPDFLKGEDIDKI